MKNILLIQPTSSAEYLSCELQKSGINVIAIILFLDVSNKYDSIDPTWFNQYYEVTNLSEVINIAKVQSIDW